MELIPINDSKLKIMLDEIDMKEYRLGAESDCADMETRRAIRNILDLARDQIGFNTEGAEIFVQLYTSKKGGCELFITKGESYEGSQREVGFSSEKMSAHLPIKDDRSAHSRQKKRESAKGAPYGELAVRDNSLPSERKNDIGKLAFSFDALIDLCKVCRIMLERGIKAGSQALYDDAGIFYLLLYNTGMSAYSRLDRFSFITEYGIKESSDRLLTYLGEHGNTICNEGAIELLGNL
ncbi:MAG: adaptor protein MecA [Ruminococcaceae bacterium]|nr:adaptor protein MecA [Oscillospiraceae bacterium]